MDAAKTILSALTVFGAAAVIALAVHGLALSILRRAVSRTKAAWDDAALARLKGPVRLALVLAAWETALAAWGVEGGAASGAVRGALQVFLTAAWPPALAWAGVRGVFAMEDALLASYDMAASDNLRARRLHTQVRIFNRILVVAASLVAVAASLMGFENFRQLGAGLLASAGLAGLVLGLAAQRTIGNVLAGVQLALTQPIRLDDVVVVEGEWGRIEEVAFTFVVVRIWDMRRLVVPVSYFLEKPFQNWTRESSDIMGAVFLHADYTVPVDAVRGELERIVRDHPLWDGRVCNLVVTDAGERTLQLRALVSASDSGRLWDLRCHVREKLVDYLRREHSQALPRVRAELPEQGTRHTEGGEDGEQ